MTVFTATIAFKGANSKVSRMTLKTEDIGGLAADAYADAVQRVSDIVDALLAVTDADIVDVSVNSPVAVSAAIPSGPGAGDVFEKALAVLRIPSAENANKTANLMWPAPSLDVFQGTTGIDRDRLDITDAAVIALVLELAANWEISDGEPISTTVTNGIVSGHRVVTKMQLG